MVMVATGSTDVGSVGNSSVIVWQLTKSTTMAAATMSHDIRLRVFTGPPALISN